MPFARVISVSLTLLACLLGGAPLYAGAEPVQSIFLGDRSCADTADSCVYPSLVPGHRYLHVVIHDIPNTYQWRVEMGPTCSELADVAGGDAIPESGYLEKVIDLASVQPSPLPGPLCLVLRGGEGWPNTYYAVYLDDEPVADAEAVYPGYEALYGRPDLPDIDVTYIHRSPSLAYDAVPNAPRAGDVVTFQAHIVNAGAKAAAPFQYHWLLDGHTVRTGSFKRVLQPGEEGTVSVQWRWEDRPHEITLATEPAKPEMADGNDRLSVRTNALTLGFWVERSAYEYFRNYQWTFCRAFQCGESNSLEDWLQRQLHTWNDVLAQTDDPAVAPSGLADRIRLDEVVVVPDGSLPLHGDLATNSPDRSDHSVDLEWGMPAASVQHGYLLDRDGAFDLEWSLFHELGHARSLIDLYRFDVSATGDDSVDVTAADGRPAFTRSNPLDATRPLVGFSAERHQIFLYRNQEADLMSCDCWHFYSTYDALALNRIRNRRAVCGNTNPPCNIGDWLDDIPPSNRLRILDVSGTPVPDGTEVHLFFDGGTTYNGHTFNDADSAVLHTVGGRVALPTNPFRASSITAAGHNLLLIEVRAATSDTFCFAEPTDFTMAYWYGYRAAGRTATYRLRLGDQLANGCNLGLPPSIVNEPFATSPYASTFTAGPKRHTAHGAMRDVQVRLVDDADPTNPMRNRVVVVKSASRELGRGTTGRDGEATIPVSAVAARLTVVDLTDNSLVITGQTPAQPPAAAQRPSPGRWDRSEGQSPVTSGRPD